MFGFLKNKYDDDNIDTKPSAINKSISDIQFIELELMRWKQSKQRKNMIIGERYYNNDHDILKRKRTVIGKDGELQEVKNLPNNKIIDNQYSKMVDQKVNYILGKPLTFDCENEKYVELLQKIFNNRFFRTLNNLTVNMLNCGIAWLYPYYDDNAELHFIRFEPFEILPFWKDADHTILDFAVRLYEIEVYEGMTWTIKEKVEVYYPDRIEKYDFTDGKLKPDTDNPVEHYIIHENENETNTYSWGKVPLIAFKYGARELPLINNVKGLQDSINEMLSDFKNNMQEDSRNTILIIKNYDGQNLAEFRHNLATYGAVKVKTIDGSEGGVDSLKVEVNSTNYAVILQLLKKALIENAKGYDAKDDRLSGNPNQMNIQSMYSDIDLDSDKIETEFKASFESLLEFVNIYLSEKGLGDFSNEIVNVVFNRNIMMNTTELIENCNKSLGLLSEETILTQHPWVENAKDELKRKEQEISEDELLNAFNQGLQTKITDEQ